MEERPVLPTLPCAAGPGIVKPEITTVTVPRTHTAKIALTRTLEITQICVSLTCSEVKHQPAANKRGLLGFQETRIVTVERVQSIAMAWHGLMILMIRRSDTGAIISSLFPCMTTCINVDM